MIREATREDILHVLANTQAIEIDGLNAVLWGGFDAEQLSAALAQTELKWCCCAKDGEPVVVGGLMFKTPAVMESWMFGTHRWGEVVLEVTSKTRKVFRTLLEHDARRIEIYSYAGHRIAHRWYERGLGLGKPLELKDYGANGETFYLYSMTRGDL